MLRARSIAARVLCERWPSRTRRILFASGGFTYTVKCFSHFANSSLYCYPAIFTNSTHSSRRRATEQTINPAFTLENLNWWQRVASSFYSTCNSHSLTFFATGQHSDLFLPPFSYKTRLAHACCKLDGQYDTFRRSPLYRSLLLINFRVMCFYGMYYFFWRCCN